MSNRKKRSKQKRGKVSWNFLTTKILLKRANPLIHNRYEAELTNLATLSKALFSNPTIHPILAESAQMTFEKLKNCRSFAAAGDVITEIEQMLQEMDKHSALLTIDEDIVKMEESIKKYQEQGMTEEEAQKAAAQPITEKFENLYNDLENQGMLTDEIKEIAEELVNETLQENNPDEGDDINHVDSSGSISDS